MAEFELDPRLPSDRDQRDAWEDIGSFDNLDLKDLMAVLKREHNIQLDKNSAILEIGVGKARLFTRLKAQGYDITGVEARKRKEHTDLPIAHIRIEEMPFWKKTATFDMVIGASVFDSDFYIQDQKLMVSRIVDALRPGGVFVYSYGNPRISENKALKLLKMPAPYDKGMKVFQKVR